MIHWKAYLDDVEYEQPQALQDMTLTLKRDEYHGVFYEATINTLVFNGAAAFYILEKKRTEGINANIIFRADILCGEDGEYENLIPNSKLNMSKVKRLCGDVCTVEVPVEQEDCVMLLLNRFDQKVDLDTLFGFDKVTALQPYDYAGFTLDMPSKALQVSAKGSVAATGDRILWSQFVDTGAISPTNTMVRPSYAVKVAESITTTQLEPEVWAADDTGLTDSVISPVVLIDEDIDCFDGAFSYNTRFKGRLTGMSFTYRLDIIVVKGLLPENKEFPLSPYEPDFDTALLTILHQTTIAEDFSTETIEFDQTYTGTTNLANGEGIWGFALVMQQGRQLTEAFPQYLEFDPETSIEINGIRNCPATTAKVYMINEAMSRVTEAITNACLKVRSDYYGRTDSQPYAASTDGCGALRAINSGLQLRNAVDAKAFISLKDIFLGLDPIDNIGFGVEPDPDRTGLQQLRVEPVEYWYRNEEVLRLPLANKVEIDSISGEYYAKAKIGYEKWEVEKVNGLDEFNSNKEFRTALTSVDNVLTVLSKFVAGGYPIEVTRQQSYAETGAADTKYDNETFIYCVERLLYGMRIEQGNVSSATNMFDPSSIYNWRIRPLYNLMRWFKTIAAGYPHIGDTEKKLFFTSGTGNYLASGTMTSPFCKLETGVKAENSDLGKDDFAGPDYHPIWRPENIKLTYPCSVGDYKKLRNNPYGFISVQCGTSDEWVQGYIKQVDYTPKNGTATFNLKMKWLQQ